MRELKKQKLNFIFCLLSLSIFVSCCSQLKEQKATVKQATIVIDVRNKVEFDSGHLENAINIPFPQFQKRLPELLKYKNQKVVLYCKSGKRSGWALHILKKNGFTDAHNVGSYINLIEE